MSNEPMPQHAKAEPQTPEGSDQNEHWPWGRSDSADNYDYHASGWAKNYKEDK